MTLQETTMSDQNQKKSDADKKPTTAIEKDGAQQPTDAELDRVEGGLRAAESAPMSAPCRGIPCVE